MAVTVIMTFGFYFWHIIEAFDHQFSLLLNSLVY